MKHRALGFCLQIKRTRFVVTGVKFGMQEKSVEELITREPEVT